nr:hypothetical protein [Tanacetum cinerariifolium]
FEEEIRLIENLLYDNSFPRPPEELNAKIVDIIIESLPLPIPVQDGNSQQEEINIVTETDDMFPLSVENDDDDLSNYSLLEEADLLLVSDNSIPPGIENVVDDPEGDICFLEELLIDNSILSHESFDSSFEDNPSISRPPPEPPDAETDIGEEIAVIKISLMMITKFSCLIRCFLYTPLKVRIRSLILFCESPIEIVIFQLLSLRTTEFRDRVELTTRIIPRRLKLSCVGYVSGFQDLHIL